MRSFEANRSASSFFSGATCYSTADRVVAAAAATDTGHTTAVHEYGNDAARPARSWRFFQSLAARHGKYVTTDGFSVPQPASTAAERSYGTKSTHVTPS